MSASRGGPAVLFTLQPRASHRASATSSPPTQAPRVPPERTIHSCLVPLCLCTCGFLLGRPPLQFFPIQRCSPFVSKDNIHSPPLRTPSLIVSPLPGPLAGQYPIPPGSLSKECPLSHSLILAPARKLSPTQSCSETFSVNAFVCTYFSPPPGPGWSQFPHL